MIAVIKTSSLCVCARAHVIPRVLTAIVSLAIPSVPTARLVAGLCGTFEQKYDVEL